MIPFLLVLQYVVGEGGTSGEAAGRAGARLAHEACRGLHFTIAEAVGEEP